MNFSKFVIIGLATSILAASTLAMQEDERGNYGTLFSNLPNESLIDFIKRTPLEERLSLSQSCTDWKKLIDEFHDRKFTINFNLLTMNLTIDHNSTYACSLNHFFIFTRVQYDTIVNHFKAGSLVHNQAIHAGSLDGRLATPFQQGLLMMRDSCLLTTQGENILTLPYVSELENDIGGDIHAVASNRSAVIVQCGMNPNYGWSSSLSCLNLHHKTNNLKTITFGGHKPIRCFEDKFITYSGDQFVIIDPQLNDLILKDFPDIYSIDKRLHDFCTDPYTDSLLIVSKNTDRTASHMSYLTNILKDQIKSREINIFPKGYNYISMILEDQFIFSLSYGHYYTNNGGCFRNGNLSVFDLTKRKVIHSETFKRFPINMFRIDRQLFIVTENDEVNKIEDGQYQLMVFEYKH